MALYKKDVVVKPDSELTYEQAIQTTRDFANSFQNAFSNKKIGGGFFHFFFADMYDSRSGNIYRVFSDACATEYDMTPDADGLIKFVVLDNAILQNHETRIEVLETTGTGSGATQAYVID